MQRVLEVKHKCHLSVPDEMHVPAKCIPSACRGRGAGLSVILAIFILHHL